MELSIATQSQAAELSGASKQIFYAVRKHHFGHIIDRFLFDFRINWSRLCSVALLTSTLLFPLHHFKSTLMISLLGLHVPLSVFFLSPVHLT